ncbi:MAG: hypothetical protein JWP01_3599 [Myxococcales bacterium]|nr:hypothetical protein [Myxococcales bacterium]
MSCKRFLMVAALAAGCAEAENLDSGTTELAFGIDIDASPGSMILGSSTDRRWIAYGTECDAGDERTRIKLYDTMTTFTTELDQGVPCQPGAVVFSPDGWLVAFGDGQGHLKVHDALWHRTVSVSREGLSTIGVVFSPDSQWFVVASADLEQQLGTTLDAWESDLTTHVQIDTHAFFSPFGPGPSNLEFSPDSQRLLYLGDLGGFPPLGTLKIWQHDTGTTRVLATGVPATTYAIRADWQYVAYLRDATVTTPDAPTFVGTFVVRHLATNQTRVIETAKNVRPLGFAGDKLLYAVYGAPTPVAPLDLKAHHLVHASTTVIDSGVFAGYGPNPIAISPDGSRVAYTRNLDQLTFTAELRVANTVSPAQPRTIAPRVIPINAYGWLDGGRKLAYLHDPTSTFVGATTGTLSAWDAAGHGVVQLGQDVTQIGLAFDSTGSELVFAGNYDMAQATGDLRAWNARSGAKRLLGRDAAVISVQRSPDLRTAGYLQLQEPPTDDSPPGTLLRISRIVGLQRTIRVDENVTSFAMGWFGRVVYTTSTGVVDAITY